MLSNFSCWLRNHWIDLHICFKDFVNYIFSFCKSIISLWHLAHKDVCTQEKKKTKYTTVDTHSFRIWHVVFLVKETNHMPIDTVTLTWHALLSNWKLRWHFWIKCRCQLTIRFCFWKRYVTPWIWSWASNEICEAHKLAIPPQFT